MLSADWQAAFDAARKIYLEKAYSNIALNETVLQYKNCKGSFVRAFVKGVIKDTIRLDYIISSLALHGIKSLNKRTVIILRLGIYAIDNLDSVPEYAAVNEAVLLAKKYARGTDKITNGILRQYIRSGKAIEFDENDLSIKYSFPKKAVELIEKQYGSETENILKGLNKTPSIILRINGLKTNKKDFSSRLATEGFNFEDINNVENAIAVSSGDITSTYLFREGYCSIQSLSSIKAINALSPEAGSNVLDLCAAPGGKSTAAAELMGDKGKILSCDIHKHRVNLIKASAERLGLSCIKTMRMDGTNHNLEMINTFDYVIADVPCSGIGTIASKPDIKIRFDEINFNGLIDTQKKMLENAFDYAKYGGIIEYMTCTINKNENENVVKSLLSAHTKAEFIEMRTILPYNNDIGFFYCIIRKNAH